MCSPTASAWRSEEHTSELQSPVHFVLHFFPTRRSSDLVSKPVFNARAMRFCPAGSTASLASAWLVRNSGSTRAPGIVLVLSTHFAAAGPSSIRCPYVLPDGVSVEIGRAHV